MAKKKAVITAYIWAAKHKGNDVWRYALDQPGSGPLIEPRTRYTRKWTAKVGAMRQAARIDKAAVVNVVLANPKTAKR